MSNYFFAASDNSFYCDELHAENMPADAKPVTEQVFRDMLEQRSAGKIIAGDAAGMPVAVDPPPPTTTELWSAYQSKAQAQLDANDAVAIRCIKAGVAYPAEWLASDNALRAIVRASSGDPTQPLPQPPKNADGSTNYPSGT